jgi:hypothetical protein
MAKQNGAAPIVNGNANGHQAATVNPPQLKQLPFYLELKQQCQTGSYNCC